MLNLSRIFTTGLLLTIAVSHAPAQVASGTIVGVAADSTSGAKSTSRTGTFGCASRPGTRSAISRCRLRCTGRAAR